MSIARFARHHPNCFTVLLIVILGVTTLLSLQIGASGFGLSQWWSETDTAKIKLDETIIIAIRLPRVVMAGLVGASLGVTGALMQGFLRNPLADPGLLGVSSGAALAASVAIVCGASLNLPAVFGVLSVPFCGMLGSAGVTLLLFVLARSQGETSVPKLLLTGVAISGFAGALTGLLTYCADDRTLRDLTFWLMGSFSGVTWGRVCIVACFVAPAMLLSMRLATALNAMALGERDAALMGYPVERIKNACLLISVASVGPAVSMVGAISFVGLIVPHVVRLISGTDHRHVLLGSALFGAILLECADLLARTLVRPAEIPVGIITALIGTPIFVWVLKRSHLSEAAA